ncbi:MAG: MFS transporter [Dehalococcoidales bacterium]|nr:MFS transporter [Dehalococcoidales bacterium]
MINSDILQEATTADSRGRPPYERPYRWVMLALTWLSYFTFGLVTFSLAPLVTPIIKDLDISYSQMGFIMGAWPLTYIMVATIGGAVVDRLGTRKSIFFGVIIIGLSAGLRYFANGFVPMFFCVALFGIGGPLISIGNPKTISQWFRGKERGMAVGIYMTGVWIGSGLSVSLMNSVIMPLTDYNWRIAFAGFGLVALAVACLWWFLGRDVKAAEDTKSDRIDRVFKGLISVRNVQIILLMGLLTFAAGHGFGNWLPRILEGSGLSPAMAGIAASLPTWAGIPTIIIVPRVISPHFRGRFIAIASLICTVALLVISQVSGAPLIITLIIYGMATCCIFPFLVLILMELPEVESKYMGAAGGMFFCVAELGTFAGPFLMGAIKDLAGGFTAGIFLLAGLSFLRIIIAATLRIKSTDDKKV